MTKEEADALLDPLLDYYRTLFRLQDWDFWTSYGRLAEDDEGAVRAEVKVFPDRWRAEIEFDLEHMGDEVDFARTIRHELLHVVCWPFEQLSEFVAAISSSEFENPYMHVRSKSAERLVGNLENLLSLGLALTVEQDLQILRERGKLPAPKGDTPHPTEG